MTLTELRYIVAVARERHFGRAAEACFVSQPTLSVAVKKLEDELGVQIFERGSSEVTITPTGSRIIEQAQRALEETGKIKAIAKNGVEEQIIIKGDRDILHEQRSITVSQYPQALPFGLFHDANVQFAQLLGRHWSRRAHHQVFGLLVHREDHDLADVGLVGQQHDDAVHPRR